MRRYFWLILPFIFIIAMEVSAFDGFKCIIKDTVSPDSSGRLVEDAFYKGFQGREFTVDRKTGRMIGALKNHEYYGEPKIINTGSEKKAFRVVTEYRPSVKFEYLTVETYEDNEFLPFLFVSSSTIMSGTCSKY